MQRTVIGELSQQRMLRAAYSERQLEEVMVDFWMNHFNVFVGKGQVRQYLTEYERDAIRPRVLGKFRDLLGASAASPAMLFYLDNWQSTAAPDAPTSADADACAPPAVVGRSRATRTRRGGRARARGRSPVRTRSTDAANGRSAAAMRRRGLNENYARELMELHTLGVDGGYTQKDVQEVARAFTGWTIANPRLGGDVPLRAAAPRRWREGRAGASDQGGRRQEGRGARCSICWRGIRRRRGSSPRSWRGGSWPTSRRRRSSRGPRNVQGDRRRHSRGGAGDRHLTGVLREPARQDQEPVRVRRQRGPRHRARRRPTRCRWCSRCAISGCRSTARSRRPATRTRPKPGSTPARCSIA